MDVTPRRLQSFVVASDSAFSFEVTRLADGAVVQSGTLLGDALGLLTVPGVKVYRAGTRVALQALGDYSGGTAGVGDPVLPAALPEIVLAPNPARGDPAVRVAWPTRAPARLDLFDASGRRLRALYRGPGAGDLFLRVDRRGLAPGLYLVAASQGGARRVRRLILLR